MALGLDAIPPTRSQEKKWSDEIRKELLPTWLRDHAHPIVEAAMAGLSGVKSRVTESCIFIDYEPLIAPSRDALPSVMLEFGARSTGEPSSVRRVQCDMQDFIQDVSFPTANPRVMEIERIFWEKATAAHVYCVQGEAGLSQRFSRHFHDLSRLSDAGFLPSVLKAREVAKAVSIHKNAFFAEKDATEIALTMSQQFAKALHWCPVGMPTMRCAETISAWLTSVYLWTKPNRLIR